jgi:molybdate/tungstate transport system substrate-binding protein
MNSGGSPEEPRPADALVAGSLQSLATAVPGGTVEAHGSLAVRQFVRDGVREPDAVALADPALFDGLADRMTLFATNALTLAYDPDSPLADDLRADWASALQDPAISVGRTDPETDPLGYRTVLALDLAAGADRLDPAAVLANTTILPEVQIARVLDRGGVDAAFVYRNMSAEYDFPTVDLPARIDFSDPSLAGTYASVSLRLDDRTVRGAPIRYAAAALTPRGRDWVERLTSDRKRLREHGFSVPDRYPVTTAVG